MTLDTTRLAPGQLAALVGSRLCHDLVSPLGAIGNGVELLEMSGEYPGIAASAEMQLIAESVAAARARIQGFRMAFGMASGDQRVSRAELGRLVEAITGHTRLSVAVEAEGDFARAEIRMLMLALMCLETAMPWGGRVLAVSRAPGWRLVADAERTRVDAGLWGWLDSGTGGARLPTPSEVQFALLAEAARDQARRITWELDETGAELSF